MEKSFKTLEQRLEENTKLILKNMNELHNHEEKINDNADKIKQNSLIIDILKDYKKETKILYSVVVFLSIVIIGLLAIIFFK